MSRVNVGILFGGRSGEHEVSIMSAASVYQYLDKEKFFPVPIGISKGGRWCLVENPEEVFKKGKLDCSRETGAYILSQPMSSQLFTLKGEPLYKLDAVFPVLHGPFGEDGTIQGLLELAGIPYVGAGVAASAVGMDKALMKKLFRQAGLPLVKDMTLMRHEISGDIQKALKYVEEGIAYPCFIKPANLGSSVGVSKAGSRKELEEGIFEAAKFDSKIIVEEGVEAREIECSVLGNNFPESSIPGEIIPSGEFYDYKAKYISDDSELIIPAEISEAQETEVRKLAVEAFKSLDCAGLGRVDFLLDKNTGKIFVNEVNTMPGFTKISMYPKLWEETGLSYKELLTKLIDLGFERYKDKSKNQVEYLPG